MAEKLTYGELEQQNQELTSERDIQFKRLASHVPGMIYQFKKRPDGTYCVPFTTEAIKDIFGCSPQDVRDDFSPISRVVLPEDLDKLAISIESSAKHMTTWEIEHRVQIPGQPVKWVFGISTPEKLADGSIIWHGFITDTTARKRAEDALRESEAKYRQLFELESDAIFLIEEETRKILEVNKSACDIYGFSREELLKMKNVDLSAEPDKTKQDTQIQLTQVPVRYHRKKDGTVFPVEITASHLKWKGRNAHIAAIRDITLRIEAESVLRASEEKYRSMMESIKDGIYINSPEFSIGYMNPTMIDRVGRDASGELCYKAIYGRDEKCSWCVFDQIEQKKHVEYEEFNQKDNRYYSVTNLPVYHAGGTVSKLTIFRDITKTKTLEERLRQSQKMEAIGTLAGGIAHDFNNILSAVIGYTELAQMKLEADSEIKDDLMEVLTAGVRAKDLVKQILAFSRQTKEEKLPVQMGLIAKEALKLIRSSLPTTIDIRQNIQSKSIVLSDPTQIHQIVMNLCTNAAHAMQGNGGILEVTLTDVALDSDFCLSHPEIQPGAYLKLSVSDTGCGMTADVRDRIFDPFFTTKPKDEGTGLGLSVVYGIVKDCGGMTMVYSEPDKGTTFNLYFPVIKGRAEEKPEEHAIIPTGTERILVVDDDKAIIEIPQKILKSLGYAVEARTSSLEALELFKAMPGKFDLVITDMTMPQMTGDALARELMKIRPDLPVILCTGFSDNITRNKAEKMGIKAFLMKPLLKKEMAHTIRKVLNEIKVST